MVIFLYSADADNRTLNYTQDKINHGNDEARSEHIPVMEEVADGLSVNSLDHSKHVSCVSDSDKHLRVTTQPT